jgi:hypothetical protein
MLAWKAWLKSLFGDVFVISVGRVFCVNVVFFKELGKTENRGGETMRVSASSNLIQSTTTYQSRVYRVQKTFFRVSIVKAPNEKRF